MGWETGGGGRTKHIKVFGVPENIPPWKAHLSKNLLRELVGRYHQGIIRCVGGTTIRFQRGRARPGYKTTELHIGTKTGLGREVTQQSRTVPTLMNRLVSCCPPR